MRHRDWAWLKWFLIMMPIVNIPIGVVAILAAVSGDSTVQSVSPHWVNWTLSWVGVLTLSIFAAYVGSALGVKLSEWLMAARFQKAYERLDSYKELRKRMETEAAELMEQLSGMLEDYQKASSEATQR